MKQSIKKELLHIIENAEYNERAGECIYKTETGKYRFGGVSWFRTTRPTERDIQEQIEQSKDELKRRIANAKKQPEKYSTWKVIQNHLALLYEHQELIPVIFKIKKFMDEGMDSYEACRKLFKEKPLPDMFYRLHRRYYIKKVNEYDIESLVGVLDMLPEAFLKDVEL